MTADKANRVSSVETLAFIRANCAAHDIEATTAAGTLTAFEVKSIGISDDEFEVILRSIAQGVSGGPAPVYAGPNYLLFRVYEAAKQLTAFHGTRVAIVIIDAVTWSSFDLALEGHWLDWAHPMFFDANEAWERFIENQMHRYPNVMTELTQVVRDIDRVWVVRRLGGYQYRLEYEFP